MRAALDGRRYSHLSSPFIIASIALLIPIGLIPAAFVGGGQSVMASPAMLSDSWGAWAGHNPNSSISQGNLSAGQPAPDCIPCPGGGCYNPYTRSCGGGGGGGSGCHRVYLNMMVFQGSGQIEVNQSNIYSNGQVAVFCTDVQYSIESYNLGCVGGGSYCYTFKQWVSTGGSVANAGASSTYFTPSSSGGNLVLVLNLTGNGWTGYVQGTSDITAVAGTFTMPNNIFPQGSASLESTAVWVGIGGFDGNLSLWQAGVEFDCGGCGTSSQTVYAQPWWEDVTNSSSGSCQLGPCYENFMPAIDFWGHYKGSNNTITVEVWTQGGYCYFAIIVDGVMFWETGDGTAYSNPVKFYPNTSTADWIVETGSGFYVGGTNIVKTEFYNPDVTAAGTGTSSFAVPLSGLSMVSNQYNGAQYYPASILYSGSIPGGFYVYWD